MTTSFVQQHAVSVYTSLVEEHIEVHGSLHLIPCAAALTVLQLPGKVAEGLCIFVVAFCTLLQYR